MSSRPAPPHLLHVFSTFVPAGPELRTVRVINALGDAFRHSILAIDGRTDARAQLAPGAPVRLLEAPPRAGTLRTVRALRRLFRAERPDLVLSYNWGAFDAVIAARTLGLPHVHHEDGFTPDESAGFKRRRELARRLMLGRAHRVVVPSERLRRIAVERWRLRPGHVQLIPNGVDLERFAPRDRDAAARARLGLPADAVVVGAVGHLRPEKNPARLLEALGLARVTRLCALVLGDGPERERLERLAAGPALQGRVSLVGHQADTAAWYGAMDLFALSSDTEQMPVALLEAMACGLPVASTDVGDVAAMLPPEQGRFVVPLGAGAAGLAAALDGLAADGALRARLGARNRARVAERYGFARMLEAYEELYAGATAATRDGDG